MFAHFSVISRINPHTAVIKQQKVSHHSTADALTLALPNPPTGPTETALCNRQLVGINNCMKANKNLFYALSSIGGFKRKA